MENPKRTFPEGFFWGVASSAYQTEGGNTNDWSVWERENATKRGGHPPENYVSGQAADHFRRFREDFDIAKKLHVNAFRISIEWSRIEPEEGVIDIEALRHYRIVAEELRKRGLEPFVTLWHFTNPLWISEMGGWKNPKTVSCFKQYAELVVRELGDIVKFWIPLNEPVVYAGNSFFSGIWPPGEKNVISFFRVWKNLKRGHIRAYEKIREACPDAQIGIAKSFIFFEAYRSFTGRIFKHIQESFWNFSFLERIDRYLDFIGVNYYFRIQLGKERGEKEISDVGWDTCPYGIYEILTETHKRFGKPLYVTENGIADAKDEKRARATRDTIAHMHRAISNGSDVRGYFHWSLTDNFEWEKGFWPRFGLCEIDYETQKRVIRKSALEYMRIAEKNGI